MLNNPKSGLSSAAEFFVSALPWVTSSIADDSNVTILDFYKITKCITVANNSSSSILNISFTENGMSSGNYFSVNEKQTVTFDIRTKKMCVKAASGSVEYSIYAGLTTIDPVNMPLLTGSLSGSYEGYTYWEGVG